MTTDIESCPVCGGQPSRSREVIRAGRVAVCGSCGSWYRIPRPGLNELRDLYGPSYYRAWGVEADNAIAHRTKAATFDALLRRLAPLVVPLPDSPVRLLDVGAATGALMESAAVRGWVGYGVELNPHATEVLKGRYGPERVHEGQLVDCPFQKEWFHVVTMTDVLEHIPDVPETLRVANRLLMPGGIVCITTPCVNSFSRHLMGRHWLHFKLEHIQYFSRRGIELVLRQTGFVDVAIRPAAKYLTLEYLRFQFQTFPIWLLTSAIAALGRLLPAALEQRPVRCQFGEMLVVAVKPTCEAVV